MASDTLTFLYPNDSQAGYDMDYLIDKHMPMIQSRWNRSGLTSWAVTNFKPDPEGMPPVYAFAANLIWDKKESLSEALGGGDLDSIVSAMTDFNKKKPIILVGDTIGKTL
ncbi:hypothetical protein V8F33_013686 [Rhypophila sp. PSN 637]